MKDARRGTLDMTGGNSSANSTSLELTPCSQPTSQCLARHAACDAARCVELADRSWRQDLGHCCPAGTGRAHTAPASRPHAEPRERNGARHHRVGVDPDCPHRTATPRHLGFAERRRGRPPSVVRPLQTTR
eukprot:scaffold296976_cov33-Tisochrysis_lutea.AAC.1